MERKESGSESVLMIFKNNSQVYVCACVYVYTCMYVCAHVCDSRSVVSDSLWPHGLLSARLLCPWDSPGKITGVGCHSLLQMCVHACMLIYVGTCMHVCLRLIICSFLMTLWPDHGGFWYGEELHPSHTERHEVAERSREWAMVDNSGVIDVRS